LNGILLIDKPEGVSSAGVVRVVKKTLAVEKIGHLGTLDPFASGLLPLCLGAGTKIAQFLMTERKSYIGTIRLGIETETLDATGAVTKTAHISSYGESELRELENRFSCDYWQTPPMYSALKRNGVPLYKLARRGVVVEREPRQVHLERFSLFQLELDLLGFSLTCSKGTYVRSLAADIGLALGCGAHLTTLRRTEFGDFSVHEALPLQALTDSQDETTTPLLSPARAMQQYRTVPVASEAITKLRRGQQEPLRNLPSAVKEHEILSLLDADGELVAVVESDQGQWRLARVL
jgi:tRNA pseudouridine55 synthase